MINYKQILANLVDFKLVDFEGVDSLISVLDNKKIRKLIINIKSKSGDKILLLLNSLGKEIQLYGLKGSKRKK